MTDFRKGRDLTDGYKLQLRKQVEQWLATDKGAAAVMAALTEVVAEATIALAGPQVTIEMMHDLAKSIEQRRKRVN